MLSRKWFVVVPMICALVSGATAASRPSKSACQLAQEWVSENMDHLPKGYGAFASMPSTYRSAVYAQLSMTDRENLWSERLSDLLSAESDLSVEQQEFVRQVITRLPLYIDNSVGSGAFVGFETSRRAAELFGAERARTLFLELVPEAGTKTTTTAPQNPPCNCAVAAQCSGDDTCHWDHCEGQYGCCANGACWCTGWCGGAVT